MTDPTPAQPPRPITNGVIALLTVKAGVTRDQVMSVMPTEIRETIQLYLNGKIREWYSRGHGRGVVLFLDASDVAEPEGILEELPLSRERLMHHDYVAFGPIPPLQVLLTT